MHRPLAALSTTLLAVVVLSACGSSGKHDADQAARPGTNATQNAATATRFFDAIASNDPAEVEAAYALAAPRSPALTYLRLVRSGLTAAGAADTVTEDNGSYQVCRADRPTSCHTFAAVVLADGKVDDFTVDGKRIKLR